MRYSTDRDAKYQRIPELDIIDAPNLLSLEYKGDEIPATFVDANLQWSCHPRELKIDSTRSMIAHVMDRLIGITLGPIPKRRGTLKGLLKECLLVAIVQFLAAMLSSGFIDTRMGLKLFYPLPYPGEVSFARFQIFTGAIIAQMAESPDLASTYYSKVKEANDTDDKLENTEVPTRSKDHLGNLLHEVEVKLSEESYLAAQESSVADLRLIPVLAR
ncbi:kinesin motor family protein [Capsicum annuum]|nr:kinesin motor family protein [Capsicum annuum]